MSAASTHSRSNDVVFKKHLSVARETIMKPEVKNDSVREKPLAHMFFFI